MSGDGEPETYVTLKEYFDRIFAEHDRAVTLLAAQARHEAERNMWIIGLVVTVANIVLDIYLKSKP